MSAPFSEHRTKLAVMGEPADGRKASEAGQEEAPRSGLLPLRGHRRAAIALAVAGVIYLLYRCIPS